VKATTEDVGSALHNKLYKGADRSDRGQGSTFDSAEKPPTTDGVVVWPRVWAD